MTEEVVINHKTYYTIRHAADAVLYSTDYITRLARERKIKAVRLGRRWYVEVDSLKTYAEVQQQEQEIRSKQLRAQRKIERLHQFVTVGKPPVQMVRFEVWTVALVCCFLLVGLFMGKYALQLSPEYGMVAAADRYQVSNDREVAADSGSVLKPVFSDDENVLISKDRSVVKPVDQESWTRIYHD